MFATVPSVIGAPLIGVAGTPDTTAKVALGTVVAAADPYWGGGEFIYLQYPVSTAVKVGALMSYDVATSFLSALLANTANLGKSVAVAVNAAASSAAAQYGWFQISGRSPVWCDASVAADTAFGIKAAGQGGAISNGKQISGARVTLPATTAVAKAGIAASGASVLRVTTTDGWFVGVALSGTGVGSGALVSGVDRDNRTITMSVVTTAAINGGTVTGTYNDSTDYYNVATYNRPFAQGQVA